MIVDTSAIMAILIDEPERPAFVEKLARASVRQVSAGSWIELSAVQVRGNRDYQQALDVLAAEFSLAIAPVTVEQARIGHEAYRKFGMGSGHSARLNFGDCFAYALARATGQPLLYKGDDFARTDIIAA
ncbi:type II toxin-antitoxin system VapC family toxin [Sphingomonas sp. dw_22]|uniref:type II toxin-antitoxin system VapC family toxin n=1 Tax=Sphingomonas sp. dw_22 TaxID=2721175 RepID=UPI001BD55960|nr:type II toxin-antitoxin system VapC family toxin [Sphingomonas sp. dw_22]